MSKKKGPEILLITPPLTQVNTPYPATTTLKGFLLSRGYNVFQADLGLELILELFTPKNLATIFCAVRKNPSSQNHETERMVALEADYLKTVESVIYFLQSSDPTLAHRIAYDGFLPEGPRFHEIEDMDWAFGSMGIQDRAKFLATQYIEDLADLVRQETSGAFGFSRYADRLAIAATDFKPIEKQLLAKNNLVDQLMLKCLRTHLDRIRPDIVGFSIPFPGCLLGALKCSQFIREHAANTTIIFGGGYVNTELRKIQSTELFDYLDFLTLDDGELPLLQIIRHVAGEIEFSQLVRTYSRIGNQVVYTDNQEIPPIPFSETGIPDYSDLKLNKYLSIMEIVNPMHRIWSDGRWNKLTLAHGCYWKRCAFCDISLDYIARYESAPITEIVDHIEAVKKQTGQSGFHFVDEAAPPDLLKNLAIEILKRDLVITWWTNIRFEKKFTADLCRLLAASGCIGVAGGLETASDRLLKKMSKGVTIVQAARAANHFQEAGIMVHAYLMYGFPTQTDQETIDALEIVRQFFENGLIQSAFWHQFALTCHSGVGKNPQDFNISITGPKPGDFAENDLEYEDPLGTDHEKFANGLQKSLFNFLHGVGLGFPLDDWFDFKVPKTTCHPNTISEYLDSRKPLKVGDQQLLWIGPPPSIEHKGEKGANTLTLHSRSESCTIEINNTEKKCLLAHLTVLSPENLRYNTLKDFKIRFEEETGKRFHSLLQSDLWQILRDFGLLLL